MINKKSSPASLALSNSFAALFDDDKSTNYIVPGTGATVTCVKSDTVLENEKSKLPMQVRSCSNHILQSTTQGELPLKRLPIKTRTANKVDGININLLRVGKTCDHKCIGVFKEKEIFIANEKDIRIIMHGDPLVIGTRQGKGHNDLCKIPLPTDNKLRQKDNEIYNLWHNDDSKDD